VEWWDPSGDVGKEGDFPVTWFKNPPRKKNGDVVGRYVSNAEEESYERQGVKEIFSDGPKTLKAEASPDQIERHKSRQCRKRLHSKSLSEMRETREKGAVRIRVEIEKGETKSRRSGKI